MSSASSSSPGSSPAQSPQLSPTEPSNARQIRPLPKDGSASPRAKSLRADAPSFRPSQAASTNASKLRHALPPKPQASTSYSLSGKLPSVGGGAGAADAATGEAGEAIEPDDNDDDNDDDVKRPRVVSGTGPSSSSASSLSAKRLKVDSSLVPMAPKLSKASASSSTPPRRLIVVLEQACLETYKMPSGSKGGEDKYVLLNCDDHQRVLARMGRDIAEARPDIVHQCLLTLLDSPLNKAGMLQIYIHTAKGVLIEVNPQIRIPRTFKRFGGLMVQLLQRLSIRSVNGSEKLLKVIKNPVTDHFPPGTHKMTLSFDAPLRRLSTYLPTVLDQAPSKSSAAPRPTGAESASSSDQPPRTLAIFIGAMAHGKDDFADGYGLDEKLSVSEYSLSASVACGKFCCAMEDIWEVY
ncbi:unnamed protein product [Jaminaea pallidilutea]